MTDELILELTGICRSFRNGSRYLPVLKGVDFQLCRGEWCCIYGASGSGKTTLMNLIGALEAPDSGTIKLCGRDVSKFSRREAAQLRKEMLGFVFQSYQLLPELTMLDNVVLAGRIAGLGGKVARERAMRWLTEVGLKERITHFPAELSGGEQQRVAIARALINDPQLLLADEPTGNLDAATGSEILALLTRLRQENPALSILMITHNPDLEKYADSVAVLSDGVLRRK